ncbi:MAG TPA: glycogen debranching N-terminal domain-containing protein, partial [Candidatus Limnocylindrales bacterium]
MAVVLHAGYSVVVSGDDGSVRGTGREGVYDTDTRLLKAFAYTLAEAPPRLVGSEQLAAHRWRGWLVVPSPTRTSDIAGPALPQDVLDLRIDRAVGPGVIDHLTIANRSGAAVRTALRLEVEPDFADVQEVDGRRRQQGRLQPAAVVGERSWRYLAERGEARFERGVRVRVTDQSGAPIGPFELPVALEPHADVTFVVVVEPWADGTWRTPDPARQDSRLEGWDGRRTR